MKTPRVDAFIPNKKPAPELKSSLDHMPLIEKPNSSDNQTHSGNPVPPVRVVPPDIPTKRVMKQRHPFDIFQDQYDALKDLSIEERKQGGIGSMSAMAREALDKLCLDIGAPLSPL